MISNIFALLSVVAVVSATDCDTLKGCYLRNLSTGKEIELTGSDSYKLASAASDNDYSLRCAVNERDGESDFIKFFYDGKIHDEFGEPRWLDGDSNKGEYIVPVPYLSTCGVKKIKIQGHVWSQLCFEKEYTLMAQCDGSSGNGSSGNGAAAPASSPAAQSPSAPVSLRGTEKTVSPALSPAAVSANAPVVTGNNGKSPVAPSGSSTVSVPVEGSGSDKIAAPASSPAASPATTPVAPSDNAKTTAPVSLPSKSGTPSTVNGSGSDKIVAPVSTPATSPASTPVAIGGSGNPAMAPTMSSPSVESVNNPVGSSSQAPVASHNAVENQPTSAPTAATTRMTETPTLVATVVPAEDETNAPVAAPVAMPVPAIVPVSQQPMAPVVDIVPLKVATLEPTALPTSNNLEPIPSQQLPTQPRSKCNKGFKMVSGYCVRQWCAHDFKCGRGMQRIPGRDCYNDRHDCTCAKGFVKRLGGRRCEMRLTCKFGKNWFGVCKSSPN